MTAVLLTNIEHPMGARTLRVERLALEMGKTYALCGANGAGKTTLLRIVAGLLSPARGQVLVNQGPVTLVHQKPYLFRGTVLHNVGFGLRSRARKSRAREGLREFGLEAFADRSTHQLSGGEAQRVALARAMAIGPRVLLLDEPTSGLDVDGQALVQKLIDNCRAARELTIVWTSPVGANSGTADFVTRIENGVLLG